MGIVTMFEITLANWGPPCWLLTNEVNQWGSVFFIGYKCTIGFAVVQVILSVFIQQTFKVASRDEEIMIAEKQDSVQAFARNLEHLFGVLDMSGDGAVSHAEFLEMLENPQLKSWFAAIEVDASQ